ncbi:thioredoxin family protein [Planctomicrobium piriforme]|uniref:Thiol-disulfide isomerase or thioredoxin n=1 Tax=Planctomicrobium piriforme TaxID=1576369 RepID=A0A1I3G2A5_9PLAN|nr:thioredoxin family protein [Planctomicrobium piriforme]SFI17618.1 Thiol-disulfide isomerase or thioredoxin [Planctomicrobium piriforme]
MNYAAAFDTALPYLAFMQKYGTAEHRRRWDDFGSSISLTDAQQSLLGSFTREMKVLVMAGTWCGDCVNQCPIFEKFAAASPCIQLRYADRDDSPELAAALGTCGGARVPAVVFLSEDGHVCGRYGDKTLSKYRAAVKSLTGASCATGLGGADNLTSAVIQDWLNEFERIQWMLRTSSRLRQLHGD